MSRTRVTSVTVLAGFALAAAGCGPSAAEKADLAKARAVVKRFAESNDASACRLLTRNAVQALYGKFTAPGPVARANCVRRSVKFRGEPVTITRSELLDPTTIKINALSADGKFSFQVNLRKGRHQLWRIDLVSQAKVVT